MAAMPLLAFVLAFLGAGAAAGGTSDPVAEAAGAGVHLSSVSGLPPLQTEPNVAGRRRARAHREAVIAKRLRARRKAAARRAAARRAAARRARRARRAAAAKAQAAPATPAQPTPEPATAPAPAQPVPAPAPVQPAPAPKPAPPAPPQTFDDSA
jgi:hypothetical protein